MVELGLYGVPSHIWHSDLVQTQANKLPASRWAAKWERLFAWHLHGFHGQKGGLCVYLCVCVSEWVRLIVYKMIETGFGAYIHITHVYKHVHVFCFSCVHLRVCACTVLVWAYPTDYFIWPTVPTIWNMGSSAGSLLWNSRWHFLEGSACALKQGSIFGQRLHWIYCVPHWHECLLDQLINLLFRMDSDHEKLSKLQSCAVFLTNLKQPYFTEYFPKAIFV